MVSMSEPLILPRSLQLLPVADLPEGIRNQFEWSEGDVAVTRLRSRTPSRIIDSEFAKLLGGFRTERTVIEAVMLYSLTEAADPRETLDMAFPILQQLVGQGLLVPPELADHEDDYPLQRGERVDEFSIIGLIRALQDSEVYQAKDEKGVTVALKVKKDEAGPILDLMLQHEAEILRRLDGDHAPRFAGAGEIAGRPYLAISWCPGIEVTHAAAEVAHDRTRLLELCTAVLDAYASLHARGVLHGDIHPGNILVDGEGQVTVIDFGLADAEGLPAPYRGGVPFYYDPQYAAAFLAGASPPRANALAEQYALSALLYQLLARANYTNFSLEEDILYKQIAEDPPLPFSAQGIEPWPQVEAALARALSKDPAGRYPDVAAFAAALRAVSPQPVASEAHSALLRELQAHPLTAELLDDLQLEGALLAGGLPRSPFASVNFGAGGVAYALYRLACIRDDPELLALADVWLARAEMAAGDPAGFYNAELEMDEAQLGPVSLYHTPSGLAAARFLVARAMGDSIAQVDALRYLVSLASQPTDNLDVTLGKAGILLIGAMLYELLVEPAWAEKTGFRRLGDSVQADLWATLAAYAPIGPACQLRNLGMAHGWAGMIYATLRWHEATGQPLPDDLPRRLQELAGHAEAGKRGLHWLWEFGANPVSMSGWCNGSAGYVYLWSLAGHLFGEQRYMDLAEGAGWDAWEDPARVPNLCCGLTGRSYGLLHLYQTTGDDRWLERARILGREAAYHIRHSQTPEYKGFEMSLYKGELATALLLADLQEPETAVLPFFASELPPGRW